MSYMLVNIHFIQLKAFLSLVAFNQKESENKILEALLISVSKVNERNYCMRSRVSSGIFCNIFKINVLSKINKINFFLFIVQANSIHSFIVVHSRIFGLANWFTYTQISQKRQNYLSSINILSLSATKYTKWSISYANHRSQLYSLIFTLSPY